MRLNFFTALLATFLAVIMAYFAIFGVQQFLLREEKRATEQLLLEEIRQNHQLIEQTRENEQFYLAQIDSLYQTGYDTLSPRQLMFEVYAHLNHIDAGKDLKFNAWQVARQKQTLTHMDQQVLLQFQTTYALQKRVYEAYYQIEKMWLQKPGFVDADATTEEARNLAHQYLLFVIDLEGLKIRLQSAYEATLNALEAKKDQ